MVKSLKAIPAKSDVQNCKRRAGLVKSPAWAKRDLSGVPIASPSKPQRVQSLRLATLWIGETVDAKNSRTLGEIASRADLVVVARRVSSWTTP